MCADGMFENERNLFAWRLRGLVGTCLPAVKEA